MYDFNIKKCIYDKLDDTVDGYNNTYTTITIKAIDVKFSTYIDFGVENNDKNPKY